MNKEYITSCPTYFLIHPRLDSSFASYRGLDRSSCHYWSKCFSSRKVSGMQVGNMEKGKKDQAQSGRWKFFKWKFVINRTFKVIDSSSILGMFRMDTEVLDIENRYVILGLS